MSHQEKLAVLREEIQKNTHTHRERKEAPGLTIASNSNKLLGIGSGTQKKSNLLIHKSNTSSSGAVVNYYLS